RRAVAHARPRGRGPRDRLWACRVADPGGALPARHPRRRRRDAAPRAPGAAHSGDGADWRARASRTGRGGAGSRAAERRPCDHAGVALVPGPAGPPFRVGQFHGRGALWTLNAITARVPYYAIFNVTGQPAASVPAGFDAAGLPLAVQLVGRPGDEATLLSLAAQIERVRPWAEQRPAL